MDPSPNPSQQLNLRPSYANRQIAPIIELAPDDSSNADSLGVIEYWRLINRKRNTLIIVSFLGLIAGLLYSLPQTPLYRTRATIEIQNMNSGFMNSKQANPVDDSSASTTDVQTQLNIVKSDSLIERVVDKLKSDGKLKHLQGLESRFAPIRGALNLPPSHTADPENFVRATAMSALTVRQIGQTRMLELIYSSPDPQFASLFLNTIATEYIQSNMEARWKMSERTGEWLTAQLEGMRIKLERSETDLQTYARESGLLFTGNGGNNQGTNVSEDRLRQLQEELSKAQAERTMAQSRYEMSQDAPSEAIGEVLNDASLRELTAKLTDLRRQEAEASVIFTPKTEKVRLIQAQIAPLQAEFDRERAAIINRIKNDYNTALRREKLNLAAYSAQTRVVTSEDGKAIQYNILKRDVDSNRQLYESTLQQVKESSVASAIRASNIRIVDSAKIPGAPFAPDYRANAIVGLLGGALLGVTFILTFDRADRTLLQPGDAQSVTNIPELGAVPSAKLLRTQGFYGRALHGYYGRSLPEQTQSIGNPNLGDSIELISWKNRLSVIAEAFRIILTSILFYGEERGGNKVLVFTSASAGEGKTTLVTNLGILLAEIGRNVLIIDADLRRPRLHQIFDLPNEFGLSTVLNDITNVEEEFRAAVQESDIPRLSILSSGPQTSHAANLLYSQNMAELMSLVKTQYDMVLIDTPPTLQMTDARVVGNLADAVVIVTRARLTTRDALAAVARRLTQDGSRVIGTVLNDWDPRQAPNGYYGTHGYYGNKSSYSYSYAQQKEQQSSKLREPWS